MKAFFKEKGLYLLCLALVLVATVTGVLAVSKVVHSVTELAGAPESTGGGERMEPARHHCHQPGRGRAPRNACAHLGALSVAVAVLAAVLCAAAAVRWLRRGWRVLRFGCLAGRFFYLAGRR